MKTIYGFKGQPAGSIDGDSIFWRDGTQIAVLRDDHIFSSDDGAWLGSFVSGVVFNAYDKPEGFTEDWEDAIPPLPPKIPAIVPPRLKHLGRDVSGMPHKTPPDFLVKNGEGLFR